MKKLTGSFLEIYKLIYLTLLLMLFLFSGCSKDEDDGILSGTLTYAEGLRNEGPSTMTQAYCYIFLDNDNNITNGFVKRLIIDLMNYPEASTAIPYEIDVKDVPAGTYFLMGAYDFAIDNDGNTDPENPSFWEAKGWYGSTSTAAPASANVSDLSGDYDLTLYGLGK
jgi:hypothetical protein